ncbi:TadE/TadG family type IV pilus assembly protein [Altererythrobacter lutimaris]|uniref:Pilus assembly protein n=1 Tax=Altererythrobacter lutimaris TaxID=2743979 RepID=A0A850H9L6_9SPHN|nr:TadE family protein [Altererythrobacter lutimaris]NVE94180.1 pilus assembly protein [Altererythrobacter lutimaris]
MRKASLLLCQKGAAAAEMALILPLAVLILFTTLEGAHYFYAQHQVVKGVRDGARWGARQDFASINCQNGTASSVPTAIRDSIRNLTRTGQLTGGEPRVLGWEAGDITVSITCPTDATSQTGIYDSTDRAPQINVAATVDYVSLFGGVGVINDTANLRASQQATVVGI